MSIVILLLVAACFADGNLNDTEGLNLPKYELTLETQIRPLGEYLGRFSMPHYYGFISQEPTHSCNIIQWNRPEPRECKDCHKIELEFPSREKCGWGYEITKVTHYYLSVPRGDYNIQYDGRQILIKSIQEKMKFRVVDDWIATYIRGFDRDFEVGSLNGMFQRDSTSRTFKLLKRSPPIYTIETNDLEGQPYKVVTKNHLIAFCHTIGGDLLLDMELSETTLACFHGKKDLGCTKERQLAKEINEMMKMNCQ